MEGAQKRQRSEPAPGEVASTLEASAAWRLEKARDTIDGQAQEIERLRGEMMRMRQLEVERAAARAGQAAAVAASPPRAEEATRKLTEEVYGAQSEATALKDRADEAERRYAQLLREYQTAEEDRLRLASQLKEAVEQLEASAAGRGEPEKQAAALERRNAELTDSAARAERSLAEAGRAHANELQAAQAVGARRLQEIEQLQRDLADANASLAASRKETRQCDEMEAQLLRVKCELREQQRLSENAEVVRSLQSALHDHSADVAAARRLKQRTDNAEALNEEIASLRTKLVRAEKAAEAATLQQVEHEARGRELQRWRGSVRCLLTEAEQAPGQPEHPLTPELVTSRIQALQVENVRQAADTTQLSTQQAAATAAEKNLREEVVKLRTQAAGLRRDLAKAERQASQLAKDIEFERYQKSGLQQLVDSFASTPADTPEGEAAAPPAGAEPAAQADLKVHKQPRRHPTYLFGPAPALFCHLLVDC